MMTIAKDKTSLSPRLKQGNKAKSELIRVIAYNMWLVKNITTGAKLAFKTSSQAYDMEQQYKDFGDIVETLEFHELIHCAAPNVIDVELIVGYAKSAYELGINPLPELRKKYPEYRWSYVYWDNSRGEIESLGEVVLDCSTKDCDRVCGLGLVVLNPA